MVKVITMSIFVRISSRVRIASAGAPNRISRMATMWLTGSHGNTKWVPGPTVL